MTQKIFPLFHLFFLIALLVIPYQSETPWCDEIITYKTETSNYFTHVEVENNNSIWFGSGAAVYRLVNNKWQAIEVTPYSSSKLYDICVGEKGSYFAWENHLSFYSNNAAIDISLPKGFITDDRNTVSMIILKDGSVLHGCDQGLLRLEGDTWIEIINDKYYPHGLFYPFVMEQASDGSLWISRLGNITHLTNNLETIENIDPPTELVQAFISMAIDKNSSIWLGTVHSGQIIRYKNNIWDIVYKFPEDEDVLDIKIDFNNILWVGTQNSGLLKYDSTSWKRYTTDDGLPSNQINEIAIAPDNTKWIATPNGAASIKDLTSGINPSPLLQSLSLLSSPNPFNSSTTLTFSLPSPCSVSLAIYSLTGQKIRTMISGTFSAGSQSVLWNGRDDSGQVVSSGVYFSRLQAGKQVAVVRMLLLK
jgi:hypothetical protein